MGRPCLQVGSITEESVLYEKHQAALDAALTAFRASAMGDPDLIQEFEEKLRKGMCGEHHLQHSRFDMPYTPFIPPQP